MARAGPGAGTASPPRPRRCFPKRYGQLTNQLLGFIEDADPVLVIVRVRAAGRAAPGAGRAPAGRAVAPGAGRELARILDEDGYLADCAPDPDGSWLVTERNCAILDVARHHREACASELAFLRAVLPDATVERVSHILGGGRHCAYRITPSARPTRRPDPGRLARRPARRAASPYRPDRPAPAPAAVQPGQFRPSAVPGARRRAAA